MEAVTFLRVLTPNCFALWPLPDGRPVISRRIDPDWLEEQLQREALASAPAAPTARADAEAGVDTRRGEGAGLDVPDGPGVGEPDHTAGEPHPLPLRSVNRIMRIHWTGRG